MIRKQIYLDERTQAMLRKAAVVRGVSESEIIRESLREYLRKSAVDAGDNPLLELIGLADGREDASEHHDVYLYGKDKD